MFILFFFFAAAAAAPSFFFCVVVVVVVVVLVVEVVVVVVRVCRVPLLQKQQHSIGRWAKGCTGKVSVGPPVGTQRNRC